MKEKYLTWLTRELEALLEKEGPLSLNKASKMLGVSRNSILKAASLSQRIIVQRAGRITILSLSP
ncbi:MAG: hypothetical protein QXP84_07685 [Candidatus Korarchaeum sp.]